MDAVPIVEKPPPTKAPPTRRSRTREARRPALRFTLLAWAKLLYLRDRGPTEVAAEELDCRCQESTRRLNCPLTVACR